MKTAWNDLNDPVKKLGFPFLITWNFTLGPQSWIEWVSDYTKAELSFPLAEQLSPWIWMDDMNVRR